MTWRPMSRVNPPLNEDYIGHPRGLLPLVTLQFFNKKAGRID